MGSLANPATPLPQFNDSDVPLEPTRLRQGDSWNWIRSFDNYPSGLYTLSYILNSASNRFVFPSQGITADEDGQSFDIQLTGAQSASCPPDTYDFIAVLSQAANPDATPPVLAQQVTLVLQSVIVDPNMAAAAGPIDNRSNAKKNLDAINACLLSNADPSVQEYLINGRQLRRFTRAELIKEREYWKNEYKAEQRANGEYSRPRGIGFRFTPSSM